MPIVAMSAEIHAAIIGGILAGLTVLVGVVLTEQLGRARKQRDLIEGYARELIHEHHEIVVAAGPTPGDWTSRTPEWHEGRRRLTELTNLCEHAHGFLGAKEVREKARESQVRLITFLGAHVDSGRRLTVEEIVLISDANRQLGDAVLRRPRTVAEVLLRRSSPAYLSPDIRKLAREHGITGTDFFLADDE